MKVSNGDIWQAREALSSLLKEPWPVKTAYRLAKLARKIESRATVIEQVRGKLVRQYGAENGNGQITVAPGTPHWNEFATAFNELMAEEEELGVDRVVLSASEDLRVTPADLLALEPFVDVE